eukprot:4089789-Amphidinium_carterae.1
MEATREPHRFVNIKLLVSSTPGSMISKSKAETLPNVVILRYDEAEQSRSVNMSALPACLVKALSVGIGAHTKGTLRKALLARAEIRSGTQEWVQSALQQLYYMLP